MKNSLIIGCIVLFLLMWSCSELQEWSDPKDNIPPGKITNIKVDNLNGGARITYDLPDDKDLLGVKAVYSYSEGGEIRESFSSAFKDTIILNGYPDTNEYIVKLITIDKSRNESQSVDVTIRPLTPPVDLIRQTLKVNPTFGGLFTSWENATKDDVAILFYAADSVGDLVLYDTYYTSSASGKYSFRGLDNTEQSFRFEIRDRWDNLSSPLDTALTPLFEEEIVGRDDLNGNIWERYGWADQTCLYRGDIGSQRGSHSKYKFEFEAIFDNILFDPYNWWHTGDEGNRLIQFVPDWPDKEYYVMPIYFTIDMGKMASYSRLKYWMRNRKPLFSAPTFTSFEVWGTNNPKPLNEIGDGSKEDNLKYWTQWPEVGGTDEWKNDWIKLADCVLTLPSGQTDASLLTDEDREFIAAGFEFEIEPQYSDKPFRYIRFVLRKNSFQEQIQLSELKFWGAYTTE